MLQRVASASGQTRPTGILYKARMGGETRTEFRGDCLWGDCREADAREFADTCRALAVECISKEVKRVLVDATNCDPDGAAALRDAFTMMMLAGIAAGFRVALVTNVRGAYALFVDLQRDLALLHVQARVFEEVGAASEWLASGRDHRRSTPADRPLGTDAR